MSTAAIERHTPIQPDPVRILALGFAISLNAAILLLALRPLTPRLQPTPAPARTPPVLILQPLPVTPPKPPPPVMPQPLPHTPVPPVRRVPVRPPQPSVSSTPMSVPRPQVVPQAPTTPIATTPHTASSVPVQAHLTYLRAPAPRYPIAARRTRMQGTVTLKVLVDMQGRPQDVRIAHSSGHPLLDRAARLQVLRKWLFQPARVNGRPTPAWAVVPVVFRLRMD